MKLALIKLIFGIKNIIIGKVIVEMIIYRSKVQVMNFFFLNWKFLQEFYEIILEWTIIVGILVIIWIERELGQNMPSVWFILLQGFRKDSNNNKNR